MQLKVDSSTNVPTDRIKETETYSPTTEQLDNQMRDRRYMDKDLRYRHQFEKTWIHNIQKWNQVAPLGLEGTPNYVVPITRMATNTGIVSMRQSLPDIVPVPEDRAEKKLGKILREASAHVHRLCNMEGVMDQAIVDFAVIGNMVLESYVKTPYVARRVPILDKNQKPTGKFETLFKRDWSQSKLGTRARSPWECSFDSGATIPSKCRRCWFQDRISRAEFTEQYMNKPDNDYINLKAVPDGAVYIFKEGMDLVRENVKHDKIIIDNFQNEIEDCWRIYANGVLIWDVPLSSVHAHGKITLSLIPNHHKYDINLKTHALYGAGDPELLSDIDDLINATTNMFIRNYQLKNTYVPSIEGAMDIDDIDFMSGQPVAGKVTIQSLGQADLPEWKNFKDDLEEWAIQAVKKNYKRLEGEVAKTAYESAQKKSEENLGMAYQIRKAEAGGMLEYAKKHISDIMEYLPVEEWMTATDDDLATIEELLKSGELGDEDVVKKSVKGKLISVKVRYIEKIRTRGFVLKEGFKKGKRSLDTLSNVPELKGQDGWIAASSEYLHTKNWRLFKKIPDIILIGKTMFGQDDAQELAKLEQLVTFLISVAQLRQVEQAAQITTDRDYAKLEEKAYDAIDIDKEEITETAKDVKSKEKQSLLDQAKQLGSQALSPQSYAAQKAGQAAQGQIGASQSGAPNAGPGAAPQGSQIGNSQPGQPPVASLGAVGAAPGNSRPGRQAR